MPVEAAELLRAAGWECDTVFAEALGGAEDPDIAARCRSEGRVLFTLDLDFANIRAYPPSEHIGIVVFRPSEPGRSRVLSLLQRGIPVLATEWAENRLWIVEPGRVRIRSAGAAAAKQRDEPDVGP